MEERKEEEEEEEEEEHIELDSKCLGEFLETNTVLETYSSIDQVQ